MTSIKRLKRARRLLNRDAENDAAVCRVMNAAEDCIKNGSITMPTDVIFDSILPARRHQQIHPDDLSVGTRARMDFDVLCSGIKEMFSDNKQIKCVHCGRPATCVGSYEGSSGVTPACDDCCGHGNEDGYCNPINL